PAGRSCCSHRDPMRPREPRRAP
ncbi:BCCT family transporter, partial [Streptomyces sp. A012304]